MKNTCSVDWCDKPERPESKPGAMCMMHYHRLYRTGSILKKPKIAETRVDTAGYLCYGHNRIHRVVFRYAHPDVPPPCWNCGKELTWDMGKKMHIYHIDKDRHNNDISNLRSSCWQCNVMRNKWEAKGLI